MPNKDKTMNGLQCKDCRHFIPGPEDPEDLGTPYITPDVYYPFWQSPKAKSTIEERSNYV